MRVRVSSRASLVLRLLRVRANSEDPDLYPSVKVVGAKLYEASSVGPQLSDLNVDVSAILWVVRRRNL